MALTKKEARMIVAMAQCDMTVYAAADKVYYHKNTLLYHFEKIRKKTGLNPRNFFDLIELYSMAREILGDDHELL